MKLILAVFFTIIYQPLLNLPQQSTTAIPCIFAQQPYPSSDPNAARWVDKKNSVPSSLYYELWIQKLIISRWMPNLGKRLSGWHSFCASELIQYIQIHKQKNTP
jgi:hypothetical protein